MRAIAPPRQGYWKERYAEMLEDATENRYSAGVEKVANSNIANDWPLRAVEAYDDGSAVYLDSYSGGAAAGGKWGRLTLRFSRPGEPDAIRTYTADGPEHGYAATSPQMEEG